MIIWINKRKNDNDEQPIWVQPKSSVEVRDEQRDGIESESDAQIGQPIDNQDNDNDGFVSLEDNEEQEEVEKYTCKVARLFLFSVCTERWKFCATPAEHRWRDKIEGGLVAVAINHWRRAKIVGCEQHLELVDLPSGRKPVDSKWVFKLKMKPNDTIEKY